MFFRLNLEISNMYCNTQYDNNSTKEYNNFSVCSHRTFHRLRANPRELGFARVRRVCMFEKNKVDYKKYKRGAWRSLNERMIESGADLLLAFHEDLHTPGMGKGTRHVIELAEQRGIEVKTFTDVE